MRSLVTIGVVLLLLVGIMPDQAAAINLASVTFFVTSYNSSTGAGTFTLELMNSGGSTGNITDLEYFVNGIGHFPGATITSTGGPAGWGVVIKPIGLPGSHSEIQLTAPGGTPLAPGASSGLFTFSFTITAGSPTPGQNPFQANFDAPDAGGSTTSSGFSTPEPTTLLLLGSGLLGYGALNRRRARRGRRKK